MQQRINKYFEVGVAVLLLIGAIYMEKVAFDTDKPVTAGNLSAMAFPKVVYMVIILLCAYLIVKGIVWLVKNPAPEGAAKATIVPVRSLVTFGMIIAYALLWTRLGFTISTFLFFFCESVFLSRKRPIWLTLLLAVGVTAFISVIFGVFFKVSFPDPLMNAIRGI
ncbi:MAG: tripartite tricarboxylate transporter TctB family protein [Oscillospiraceae bacterium]|nr:tripartite tricarboxylate transporter TctB family protein [Oscillospiraceae bacterium]